MIIVLSDGKNEAFSSGTKTPHPVFADKLFEHTEPITKYQEKGISCFAVDFGGKGDDKLNQIAYETGGTVFNATDQQQLTDVYQDIRERILGEYLLTYKAGMSPADKKYVQLSFFSDPGDIKTVTRFYFSSTIFGIPLDNLNFNFLIPVLIALLLWFLLTRIKFTNSISNPT